MSLPIFIHPDVIDFHPTNFYRLKTKPLHPDIARLVKQKPPTESCSENRIS